MYATCTSVHIQEWTTFKTNFFFGFKTLTSPSRYASHRPDRHYEEGGISDRPNDEPDVYHTFFGVAGLSLMGFPGRVVTPRFGDVDHKYVSSIGVLTIAMQTNYAKKVPTLSPGLKAVDPVYALPVEVVKRLGLYE